MAELCNHYVFPDVDSPQSFLANIKNVAVSNGWVCDKDDINDNWELYLHSNHGGRNLYYSMKMNYEWIAYEDLYFYTLLLYANTGFDDSKGVDEQPGKWGQFPTFKDTTTPGLRNYRFNFNFPLLNQYVVASEQAVFVFIDFYKSIITFPTHSYPNRLIFSFGFGGIDLYNEDESEGNFYFGDYMPIWYNTDWHNGGWDILESTAFGKWCDGSPLGLLYNGVNKVDEHFGISTVKCVHYHSNGSRDDRSLDEIKYGRQGFKYRDGVQWNEWCSRTTMLKPIVSVYYEDAENEYFFPIGELPYYSCCVWPRAKAGDVLTFGSRKFIVFPLISYTETYGIAIEVNP